MPQLLADLTPLRISADFRRLWSALAVSNIGQQMTAVAVGIQVYAITGSVLAVGVLILARPGTVQRFRDSAMSRAK